MSVLDTLGIVGEILSWIGLGIGIPLLLIALAAKSVDRHYGRKRPLVHELYIIGATMTLVGVVSLLVSFLPMLLG